MSVTYVRDLGPTYNGHQVLVKKGDSFYIVSTIRHPRETLVFPAYPNGRIASYREVAGGPRMTRDDAIADLERMGDG